MSRLTLRRLMPVFLMAILFVVCAPLVAPLGVAHAAPAGHHASAVSHAVSGATGVGGSSFFGKLFGGFRFIIIIVISLPGTIGFPWPPLF